MKAMLKIAVPVIVLVAVVFGLTFFSQYTPPSDDETKNTKESNEPPLRFFSSSRYWDPPDFHTRFTWNYEGLPMVAPSADKAKQDDPFRFSLQDRIFPGFFEIQSDAVGPKNSADFWFENRHDRPITMQVDYVSCTQCTAGWVAPVPPEVSKQILQSSMTSVLPQGLFNGLPLCMVGPAADLHPDRLAWQKHSFRDISNAVYKIPAADNADGWSPQWGIVKLQFAVGMIGPKPIEMRFQNSVDGTKLTKIDKLIIAFEGINPFELSRVMIDVGEMNENSAPKKYEIIAFSSTRGMGQTAAGGLGDLAAPTVRVNMPQTQAGDPGQFVTVGEPTRVPEQELPRIAEQLALQQQGNRHYRVEAAYRYPVTINPRIGETRIDIGLMDRDIYFTLPGVEQKVAVRGLVTGAVWLDNNQHDIEVPRFDLTKGYTKDYSLVTARNDMVVHVVGDECRPKYLQVRLEKNPKPPSADRGYYILKLIVPPSKQDLRIKPGTWDGEVVLEVKERTSQRIRIPVRGRIDPR